MNTKKNTKANTTETKATKVTKTSLVNNLKALAPQVAKVDADLALRIDKALKNKKTTGEELEKLLNEAIALGNAPAPAAPVVENEVKPAEKSEKKKAALKPAEKKKVEKPEPKKEDSSSVKSLKTTGDTVAPMAILFPDSIETEVDGGKVKFRKAKADEFNTIKDIVDAMTSGKSVVFACYWTQRHIKEFNYGNSFRVPQPKSFKDNLDLAQACVESLKLKRLWAMSVYTDGMYFFDETELEPIEDVNPYTGDKYLVRVSNGMEYEIYIEA